LLENLTDYRYNQYELQAARWLFANVLQDTLQGTTTLYSCRKGQVASGSDDGGYFTSRLIRNALEMTKEHQQIITADIIFHAVQQNIVRQTSGKQIPEIENSLQIPFALNDSAVQQLAMQIAQFQGNTEQGIPTWGKILLGIGGIAALTWLFNQFDER
jgi:hypothetical protein